MQRLYCVNPGCLCSGLKIGISFRYGIRCCRKLPFFDIRLVIIQWCKKKDMKNQEFPLLEIKKIAKSFSGVSVLRDISFSVSKGELHALVGENGAGKSTLMKILMGLYSADSGEIFLRGKVVHIKNPAHGLSAGISMIHQELNPVLDMSVAENIFLGKEILKYKIPFPKITDKKRMHIEASRILHEMNTGIDSHELMRNLTVAQMQLVEIIKAITFNAELIIMDEPTSAITNAEADILFKQITALKERGTSIIYISHKMEEIFRLADTITVLRDGDLICSAAASEFNENSLIKAMVGREITDIYPKEPAVKRNIALSVKNLSVGRKVKRVSFDLYEGEVLGIAGLVGAGRSETVEAIFGMRPPSSGEIFLGSKRVYIRSPKDALSHKIALITEDRKLTGLNLKFSVKENISIVALKNLFRKGIISDKIERKTALSAIKDLNIKTHSENMLTSSLSGGNQQKVVLGKWLLNNPHIIILDEPTRGIDVGAKRDMYMIISRLAKEGKAVLVISSELPEIMGISDRIIVMNGGYITGELERSEFSQEKIMYLAAKKGNYSE